MAKKILDTAMKTELDAAKTASKKSGPWNSRI